MGHLSAIKQALRQVGFLHIGIGSSQYSHTTQNPFSAQERREMIERGLRESGIPSSAYDIHLIPDIHKAPEWPFHVKKIIPDFEILFLSNRDIVDKLFEEHLPSIKRVHLKHELSIFGTDLREKIEKDKEWEKEVLPSTASYLKEIGAKKRIQMSIKQA